MIVKRGSQKYGLLLFLFFVFLLTYQSLSGSNGDKLRLSEVQLAANPLLAEQATFWRSLYSHILFNDPQCTAPEFVGIPHKTDVGFDPEHDVPRPDVLWLKPADVEALKEAHQKYLGDIQRDPPHPPYRADTQGIVMTAGRNQLPVLVISLLMLRRTGCTLPVEVFLASKEDYNPDVCDSVLPGLNAKCLIFNDIVRAGGSGVSLAGYQYKVMALLFSSFESVMLLDSDAFPISDPTGLFGSTVFKTYGMILWPDFWFPSESPYYFEIASISPIPPLSARPATESGEVLLDKRKHNATLLLAAYYNYYGPDYYYVLHSQGAPGQGDKETFGWAATATNSSYYLVHTPVIAVGHFDSTGAFSASAMAQHDPIADYELHRLPLNDTGEWDETTLRIPDSRIGRATDDSIFPAPAPRPEQKKTSNPSGVNNNKPIPQSVPALFLHANFPKFDPSTLFLSSTQPPGNPNPTFDSNGTSVRPWGTTLSPPYASMGGYDVERAFWEEIEAVSCKYGREMQAFGDWRLSQIVVGGDRGASAASEKSHKGEVGHAETEMETKIDVCDVVRAWMTKVFGKEKTQAVPHVVEDRSRLRARKTMDKRTATDLATSISWCSATVSWYIGIQGGTRTVTTAYPPMETIGAINRLTT